MWLPARLPRPITQNKWLAGLNCLACRHVFVYVYSFAYIPTFDQWFGHVSFSNSLFSELPRGTYHVSGKNTLALRPQPRIWPSRRACMFLVGRYFFSSISSSVYRLRFAFSLSSCSASCCIIRLSPALVLADAADWMIADCSASAPGRVSSVQSVITRRIHQHRTENTNA